MSAPRDAELDYRIHPATGEREPRCEALHPVFGHRCDERAGHVWNHGYVEPRIPGPGQRVWWDDSGEMRDPDKVRALVGQLTLFE